MDGNTLFAIKQIIEEFEGQLTGTPEDAEYDGRIAVKNKKEVERLHSELDETFDKSKTFDEIKAVMDLPETTYGETFAKLAKMKEIVEGMG